MKVEIRVVLKTKARMHQNRTLLLSHQGGVQQSLRKPAPSMALDSVAGGVSIVEIQEAPHRSAVGIWSRKQAFGTKTRV